MHLTFHIAKDAASENGEKKGEKKKESGTVRASHSRTTPSRCAPGRADPRSRCEKGPRQAGTSLERERDGPLRVFSCWPSACRNPRRSRPGPLLADLVAVVPEGDLLGHDGGGRGPPGPAVSPGRGLGKSMMGERAAVEGGVFCCSLESRWWSLACGIFAGRRWWWWFRGWLWSFVDLGACWVESLGFSH